MKILNILGSLLFILLGCSMQGAHAQGEVESVDFVTSPNGRSAWVTTRRLQDDAVAYEYSVVAVYNLPLDFIITTSPSEVRDVVRLTQIFYRRVMAAAFPLSYRLASCTFTDGLADDTVNPPIVAIQFNVIFEFFVKQGIDTPSNDDVFLAASTFDSNDYLEKFVKLAFPMDLFAYVESIDYAVIEEFPSKMPVAVPTIPTMAPTVIPAPSKTPSVSPTKAEVPTTSPTKTSTMPTSSKPSQSGPTRIPSRSPTMLPTSQSGPTRSPSRSPTKMPTETKAEVAFVELFLVNSAGSVFVPLDAAAVELAVNELAVQYETDLPKTLATFVPGSVQNDVISFGGSVDNYSFQKLVTSSFGSPFPAFSDYLLALEAADYQAYGNRLIRKKPETYGNMETVIVNIGDPNARTVAASIVAELSSGETLVTQAEEGAKFSSLQDLGKQKAKKGHE